MIGMLVAAAWSDLLGSVVISDSLQRKTALRVRTGSVGTGGFYGVNVTSRLHSSRLEHRPA
jgi:hypothetical protein